MKVKTENLENENREFATKNKQQTFCLLELSKIYNYPYQTGRSRPPNRCYIVISKTTYRGGKSRCAIKNIKIAEQGW